MRVSCCGDSRRVRHALSGRQSSQVRRKGLNCLAEGSRELARPQSSWKMGERRHAKKEEADGRGQGMVRVLHHKAIRPGSRADLLTLGNPPPDQPLFLFYFSRARPQAHGYGLIFLGRSLYDRERAGRRGGEADERADRRGEADGRAFRICWALSSFIFFVVV